MLIGGGLSLLFFIGYGITMTSFYKSYMRSKTKEKQEKQVTDNVVKQVMKQQEETEKRNRISEKKRQKILATISERQAMREMMAKKEDVGIEETEEVKELLNEVTSEVLSNYF